MKAVYCHIRDRARPLSPHWPSPGPAVFLDRDGVLTKETGYLHQPEDVRFLPGAIASVARINQLGLPVVLVTNQSGIGRGYYKWTDFERVEAGIREELARAGAWLDAEWACGYYPGDITFEPGAERFRKPATGMLEEAAAALTLSLADSWLIGDKPSDIETAINAGLRAAVHVNTGYGAETRSEVVALARQNQSTCRIYLLDSLADLIPLLELSGVAGLNSSPRS